MALLLLLFLLLRLCGSSLPLSSDSRALLDTSSNSSALAQDQAALLLIKSSLLKLNSTGVSSSLNDWTSNSTSPCSWSRINCSSSSSNSSSSETRVAIVDLSYLFVSGELVDGFSNLTALSNLNLSHNAFRGSISQDLANCTRLTSLDLSSNNFSGIAPQAFSRLSSLQVLDLGSNKISGSVAQALPDGCAQLRSLNLSGNSFQEFSSYAWQNCSALQILDLSHNNLTGTITSNLAGLPSLQQLLLSSNKISGSVPESFCSSAPASLLSLDLSENNLTGTFPLSTTNCSSLQRLDLSTNNLTGNIPAEAGNYSSLEVLDASENQFFGAIPSDLGRLTSIQVFMAGSNNLSGPIPSQLTDCKNLSLLDLNTNLFEGNLPDVFGDMPSLRYLVLHSNAFSGSIPLRMLGLPKLEFLDLSNNTLSGSIPAQLANLSSLQFLMAASNNFSGPIPSELGNLTNLQFLDLSSNQLNGSIPSSFGKLQNLLWLMLGFNRLTGLLPRELGNCTSLLWFNVRSNLLTGALPPELVSMGQNPQKIFDFNTKGNNINPPTALGECLMIRRWIPETYPPFSFFDDILNRDSCKAFWLQLLTGSPPTPACGSDRLGGYFQITDNMLSGSLPGTFQGNRSVNLLLSLNRFTGSLPGGLGDMPLLALNVSHNNLSGPIPDALGDNSCLTLLDLSYNNLNGSIPKSLGNLNQLSRFNVSYNPFLSGSVPAVGQFLTFNYFSYTNDTLLCFEVMPGMRVNASDSFPSIQFCGVSGNDSAPSPTDSTSEESKMLSTKALLAIGITGCLGILLCGAMGSYTVWKWPVRRAADTDFLFFEEKIAVTEDSLSEKAVNSTVCLFKGGASSPPIKQLTYADILIATNNFDDSNVVGRGGFGVVYKADLPDGSTVAIKKLDGGGPQGEREFIAEMQTLGNHAYKNLVPLLGCCVFGSERLLVYKFLRNGSLDDWLHENQGGAETLDWSRRLRIACGCAKGLRYLHHACSPVLIHRDMKASNILLDEDFEGYLTDFGLAREMDPGDTHVSTMIAGTLGYVPPEYCQSWRATTKGDVYSFGVVLLELITGRKPVCPMESDEHVVDWVRSLLRESRAVEAYDPVVKQTAGENEAAAAAGLLEFLKLARACTEELPEQRPNMKEVANALEKMQERRDASDLKVCDHGEEDDERLLP